MSTQWSQSKFVDVHNDEIIVDVHSVQATEMECEI